jgi:glycosyltransferase involved in cell wall biosynthesis
MILLNFSPLKSGGGHTVAFNFVKSLKEINELNNFIFFAAKGSAISQFLVDNNVILFQLSCVPFLRIIQEFIIVPFVIVKYDLNLIYSYFHYCFFIGKTKQIVGCADSNLFYPDVDFWKSESRLRKYFLRLKDNVRVRGVIRADGVIFENEALQRRAIKLFDLPEDKTVTINPAVRDETQNNLVEVFNSNNEILILSGWHTNKNLLMLPKIAYYLNDKSISFTVSLSLNNSPQSRKFEYLLDFYDVRDRFVFIGRVEYENLESVYKRSSVCLLLSNLESFSNNIIEAWRYRVPLLITDADWARNICGEAAYYVNNTDAEEVAKEIEVLLACNVKREELIDKGMFQLKRYNSVESKTRKELSFLSKYIDK